MNTAERYLNARTGAALSVAAMLATFVCGLFWSGGSLSRLNGTVRVSGSRDL